MSRQISIRWDRDIEVNFEESTRALLAYHSPPDITVTTRLKGPQDVGTVRALEALAISKDLEILVTLTATWDDEVDVWQLRLWGPPTASDAVHAAASRFSDSLQDMADDEGISTTLRSGEKEVSWTPGERNGAERTGA